MRSVNALRSPPGQGTRLYQAIIVHPAGGAVDGSADGHHHASGDGLDALKSMIPHHSSAIVMCEESSLTDPEISTLCDEIVKTQREEIAQLKGILERL